MEMHDVLAVIDMLEPYVSFDIQEELLDRKKKKVKEFMKVAYLNKRLKS